MLGTSGVAARRYGVRWLVAVSWAAGGLIACSSNSDQTADPPEDDVCAPSCSGRVCGDDGCGSVCGVCPASDVCSDAGLCEAEPVDPGCEQTCAELGQACGEHCGESCGSCTEEEMCVDGACACQPACMLEACGAADGCGGTCPACPSHVSCESCPLQLKLLEVREESGARYAQVALDFTAEDSATLPSLADVRLGVDGAATLTRVFVGPPILDADKALHTDPATGRPYRQLDDGTLQILVMSLDNENVIAGGRWLVYEFRLEPDRPAAFHVVSREDTLAPAAADQALWGAICAEDIPMFSAEMVARWSRGGGVEAKARRRRTDSVRSRRSNAGIGVAGRGNRGAICAEDIWSLRRPRGPDLRAERCSGRRPPASPS